MPATPPPDFAQFVLDNIAGTTTGKVPVVPLPMSVMPNAKTTLDAITDLTDPAAFHEASEFARVSALAPVATSGSYADLTNKPAIPAAQVPSDWSSNTSPSQILNKPVLFSGAYADLSGKPTLGSAAAQNTSAFASAAQGAKADTALQSVPLATPTSDGLISAADLANLRGLVNLSQYYRRAQYQIMNVSVGTSNSDAAVFSNLPSEYLIANLWVSDPSASLALVSAGLYRTAGGLNNVVPAVTMTALTGSTVVFSFPGIPIAVEQTSPSLYFRILTGSAGKTCSVTLEIVNLS